VVHASATRRQKKTFLELTLKNAVAAEAQSLKRRKVLVKKKSTTRHSDSCRIFQDGWRKVATKRKKVDHCYHLA